MLNQKPSSFLLIPACLFAMASAAFAQEPLPDLTPVVINADQGWVEVRNVGNAAAEPSQVYVVCTTFASGEKGWPCAAGLHLPGYIEKWNSLSFDIPALKPGTSYRVQLFGSGAFPKNPENVYGMSISTDPLRKIAESNEKNNSARLNIEPKPGILRLVAQGMLPDLPVHYIVSRHRELAAKAQVARGTRPVKALPYDIYLSPGAYDIWVTQYRDIFSANDPGKMVGGTLVLANLSNAHIGSKETFEVKLAFKQTTPGKLSLHLLADDHPIGAFTRISVTDGSEFVVMSKELAADSEVNLLPGRYVVVAKPKDDGVYSRKHGYGKRQVTLDIRPGQTTEQTLKFVSAKKGKLVLIALVDGSRNKADIKVRRAGSKESFGYVDTSYNLSSNSVELVPGRYDISVLPLEYTLSPGGVDVFHGGVEGPGIKTKGIRGVEPVLLHDIEIKPGESLKRTVRFEKKERNEPK